MGKVDNLVPKAKAGSTDQTDIGVTYNQANYQFNQPQLSFNGLNGYSDVQPIISLSTNPLPYSNKVVDIGVSYSNQSNGLTYDQAGVSYNQAGDTYATIVAASGSIDHFPIISRSSNPVPTGIATNP